VFGHLLDSPRTKYLAAVASLSIGLFFTFVWAPHPWTWQGIDQYHDLARAVARGEGFNTTDVPWGYTYFAAFFYAVFGEKVWIPILVQVIANATLPLFLFAIVRPLAGGRTATLAALITGVFSFNTIYASTQASDAICSVLFLAAVLSFMRAQASERLALFALSGMLAGLATQFRPNLILLPVVVAVLHALARRRLAPAIVFLATASLVVVPWVVRNYRLAGIFLPTSSHGAVQLWYGSLQVGPYLENRTANPRAMLARSPFEYTSLVDTPIVVSLDPSQCPADQRDQLALTYWTDRSPAPTTLTPEPANGALEARIPGQPDSTTVYWTVGRSPMPFVYFVSGAHTHDLDVHDDFDDAFDLMELVTQPGVTAAHAGPVVRRLIGDEGTVAGVEAAADAVTLRFSDGSWWRVPRDYGGDAAAIEVTGALAAKVFTARRRRGEPAQLPACLEGRVAVNDVFYRRELHEMRRYGALALDNISRAPLAFAAAAAYRSIRLFVVRPSGDASITYRFAGGRAIYAAAMVLSLSYLLAFLAGIVLAWRRRSPLLQLAVPILYVPLTIAPVLTNQRYTVTVQPLMFAFVAFAIVAWLEKGNRREGANGSRTGGRT
jgi:hypothetical protein